MIGSGDHERVDLIQLAQMLEIGEHVGDLEPLRDRARLRTIVVAQRDELGALDFREHGEMRELRYRASADESESDRAFAGFCVLGANRRFGQSWFPDNRFLESYDNSAPPARGRSRPTGTSRFRVRSPAR